jgi:hypothetical protein
MKRLVVAVAVFVMMVGVACAENIRFFRYFFTFSYYLL